MEQFLGKAGTQILIDAIRGIPETINVDDVYIYKENKNTKAIIDAVSLDSTTIVDLSKAVDLDYSLVLVPGDMAVIERTSDLSNIGFKKAGPSLPGEGDGTAALKTYIISLPDIYLRDNSDLKYYKWWTFGSEEADKEYLDKYEELVSKGTSIKFNDMGGDHNLMYDTYHMKPGTWWKVRSNNSMFYQNDKGWCEIKKNMVDVDEAETMITDAIDAIPSYDFVVPIVEDAWTTDDGMNMPGIQSGNFTDANLQELREAIINNVTGVNVTLNIVRLDMNTYLKVQGIVYIDGFDGTTIALLAENSDFNINIFLGETVDTCEVIMELKSSDINERLDSVEGKLDSTSNDVKDIKSNYVKNTDYVTIDKPGIVPSNLSLRLFNNNIANIEDKYTYTKNNVSLKYSRFLTTSADTSSNQLVLNTATSDTAGAMSAEDKTNLDSAVNKLNGVTKAADDGTVIKKFMSSDGKTITPVSGTINFDGGDILVGKGTVEGWAKISINPSAGVNKRIDALSDYVGSLPDVWLEDYENGNALTLGDLYYIAFCDGVTFDDSGDGEIEIKADANYIKQLVAPKVLSNVFAPGSSSIPLNTTHKYYNYTISSNSVTSVDISKPSSDPGDVFEWTVLIQNNTDNNIAVNFIKTWKGLNGATQVIAPNTGVEYSILYMNPDFIVRSALITLQ